MTDIVAALVVWAVIPIAYGAMLLKYGREYRFPRTERYLRDPDVFGLTPAQVGYAWRMGHITEHEINATILDLADRGVIAIADAPGRDDATLTLTGDGVDDLLPHETAILEMLFGGPAVDDDTVSLSRVAAHPSEYIEALQRFKLALVTWAEDERVFEPRSFRVRALGEALGIVMVVISLGIALATDIGAIMVVGLPLGIAMFLCAPWMLRESRPAARTRSQAEALRRYLHDFGRLGEKPPAGVVLWGRYLVYAELFGMAEEARSELRRHADHLSLTFGSITWTLDAIYAIPLSVSESDKDDDLVADGDAATAPPSAS